MLETSRAKIVTRLLRDGWEMLRRGGDHDVFAHPDRGQMSVPRHRTLSTGVARSIARQAGWQ
jgi:predicted RNA binding protein YcfA (HicA-like mRNA interferase family)